MEVLNKNTVKNTVNKDLTTIRNLEIAVKRAKPSKLKLGEETIAKIPSDFEVMYLGAVLLSNIEQQVRVSNMHSGMIKAHGAMPPELEDTLISYKKMFEDQFAIQKKAINKIIVLHPLAPKLTKIKGFTEYQLGMIMSLIKDPTHFKSPSNLFVYAGVAPKNGKVVTLSTLAEHRQAKHDLYARGTEPEDFTEFGINFKLKARMFNVVESLLKQKGFFYKEFQNARVRLAERAINNNECYRATEQDVKDSKGVMKLGEYYMHNKKNQSLIMWTYRNASWRQARTLLHLIYCEWLELKGVKARDLYAIEYLGHQRLITIDEVLQYEATHLILDSEVE